MSAHTSRCKHMLVWISKKDNRHKTNLHRAQSRNTLITRA